MARPEITDNPAKPHHHPTHCGLNLPHSRALTKLMEGISGMLFLLSCSYCHLVNGGGADVGENTICCLCLVLS